MRIGSRQEDAFKSLYYHVAVLSQQCENARFVQRCPNCWMRVSYQPSHQVTVSQPESDLCFASNWTINLCIDLFWCFSELTQPPSDWFVWEECPLVQHCLVWTWETQLRQTWGLVLLGNQDFEGNQQERPGIDQRIYWLGFGCCWLFSDLYYRPRL